MEALSLFSVLGFLLAAYSVVANDSVQTLGTFMNSNKKVHWGYLWIGASVVLVLTLTYSWVQYNGDLSFGRLDKIPFKEVQWFHVLAPLTLLGLTRVGIPVSTSFLVLSAFASSLIIEKMLLKSAMGYAVAAIVAYGLWFCVAKLYIKRDKTPASSWWRAGQWASTGILWCMWLSHDISNVVVFLPRTLDLPLFLGVLTVFVALLGFMFYERGGKIQEIISLKTNTSYVKSAILIDIVYALILWYFKMYNNIPMSTTFVFIGLLAGRELALGTVLGAEIKNLWPVLSSDFLKMMVGLGVSIALAFTIHFLQG